MLIMHFTVRIFRVGNPSLLPVCLIYDIFVAQSKSCLKTPLDFIEIYAIATFILTIMFFF